MRARTAHIVARLRGIAALERSRKDAAAELGLSYRAVQYFAREYGIAFVHGAETRCADRDVGVTPGVKKRDPRIDPDRTETMAFLYRAGYTLAEIGARFGITRERVRQILNAELGLRGSDGGRAVRSAKAKAATRASKNAACLAKRGCTLDQYKELLARGRELGRQGLSRERQPIGAYVAQRRNARRRGIPFDLTLWQWWTIWQDSGKWEQRGRGQGYVMCRYRDTGPYAAGNVFIATASACARDYHARAKAKRSAVKPSAACAGDAESHCTPEVVSPTGVEEPTNHDHAHDRRP